MCRFLFGAKSICLLVLFMFLAGCGGGEADGFTGARGEVTGKVTFEGKALPEGCTILFQSTSGKNTYTAVGTTNAAGEYVLGYNGSPKLPCVAYQVLIQPPSKAAAASPIDPASAAATNPSVKAEPPPFPAKYLAFSKDFTYTVKEGKNTADFDLK